MKKLLLILLCFPLLFTSCEKCKDCELKYESDFTLNELDSIVQNPDWGNIDWNDYLEEYYFLDKKVCDGESISVYEMVDDVIIIDEDDESSNIHIFYECK